ncbi:hypothetical protein [Saccharopolyspora sp. NPDC002686]|uniref:hypothetical protein n=1 Tax=Saccharopolyspora sp. NPDC002686 TaxID=3154541 RepID=UPI003329E13D
MTCGSSWLPAGALVGFACRRVAGGVSRRLLAVGVAACVAALGTLVLAQVAGGDLGGGQFSPVSLRPLELAAMTMCWIGIPAAAVTWFAGPVDFEEPVPAGGDAAEGADPAADADASETDSLPVDADDVNEDSAEDAESPADADGEQPSTSDVDAEPEADAVDPDDFDPEIPHAREPLSSTRSAHSEIDPSEFDGDTGSDWTVDEARREAWTRDGGQNRAD